MYDPQTSSRINEIRQRVLAGTATMDELKEGIKLLREGRATALAQKVRASRPSTKSPVNVDALFDELDSLK